MKGQKVKSNQDGGFENAKKRTKNQSQKQLIEELGSVISEKDLATAEKVHMIAQNTFKPLHEYHTAGISEFFKFRGKFGSKSYFDSILN